MKTSIPFIFVFSFSISFSTLSTAQESSFDNPEELTLCDNFGTLPCTITLTNTSASVVGTTFYINEVVCITGTFIIDVPGFTFSDCKIKMSPGASIEVDINRDLFIENCKIFSCEYMWKEILAKTGSRLIVSDSEIQDGQFALHGVAVEEFACIGTSINRNHVGIRLSVKNPSAPPVYSLYAIYDNKFDCSLPMHAPYSGQTPTPGPNSFAGIWMSDIVGIGIGNPSQGTNEFKTQMIGILTENSTNVLIRNSVFEDIQPNLFYEGYTTGIGVSALDNSFVRQVGLGDGATDPVNFHNCGFAAVFSSNSTMESKLNRITGINLFGLRANAPNSNYSDFFRNRIEGIGIGPTPPWQLITIRRSSFNDDFIQNNMIDFQTETDGIQVSDQYSSTGTAIIRENIIKITPTTYSNVSWGIALYPDDGNNLKVNYNTIDLVGYNSGIYITNSTGLDNSFYNNTLKGNNSSNNGIRSMLSQNEYICLNSFEGFNTGMSFQQTCAGTEMGLNEFASLDFGLVLAGNNINLGIQNHKGNSWTGTFSNWAAIHTGTDIGSSEFLVNDTPPLPCGTDYWPNSNGVSSVDPSSGWFTPDQSTCLVTCNFTTQQKSYYNEELSELEYSILDGTYNEDIQSPPALWDNDRYIYKKLQLTGLANNATNPFILAFLDEHENSTVGHFYLVEKLIREAFSPGNNLQQEIIDISNELNLSTNEFETLHLNWVEDIENEDHTDNLLALLEQMNSTRSFRDSLLNQLGIHTELKLQEASALLSTVSCDLAHETNYKNVLTARIQFLQESKLDEATIIELTEIANQCYDIAGPAIYMAARLRSENNQTPYMSPPEECEEGFLYPDLSSSHKSLNPVNLFPNPTNGLIYFQAISNTGFTGIVRILNTTGQELKSVILNEEFAYAN